jgi:hypothetical protein
MERPTIDPTTGEARWQSPTFVCRFTDGVVTRMTTYCAAGKRDLQRGIALSRAAYHSRTKKEPPPIGEAWFETSDGVVLQEYDANAVFQSIVRSFEQATVREEEAEGLNS